MGSSFFFLGGGGGVVGHLLLLRDGQILVGRGVEGELQGIYCCWVFLFVRVPQLRPWDFPVLGWEGSVCNCFPTAAHNVMQIQWYVYYYLFCFLCVFITRCACLQLWDWDSCISEHKTRPGKTRLARPGNSVCWLFTKQQTWQGIWIQWTGLSISVSLSALFLHLFVCHVTHTGLPEEVTVRPPMPLSSQIQWAYYKYKKCKVEWESQTEMWHPSLKTPVGVLPWTCQNEGKWPSSYTSMQSNITSGLHLRRCEVLRSLRHYLQAQSQGHHTIISHLEV